MSKIRPLALSVVVMSVLASSGCLSNALINLMAPPGSNKVPTENPLKGGPAVTGFDTDEDKACSPSAFQGAGLKVTVEDGKVCLEDRFVAMNAEYEAASSPMPITYTLSTEKGRSELFSIDKSLVGVEATCHPSQGGTMVVRAWSGKECVDNAILTETSEYLAVEVAGLPGYELLRFAFQG